jgi:thiosulfate/3-mercaptopyruvate sulfurtransferase
MSNFSPFVSAEWLMTQGDNSRIVVIDCRFRLDQPLWGQEQYQLSHILGAYYFDLDRDLSSSKQLHGGRHPLPDLESLSNKLSLAGVVFGESLVVIYDDTRFAYASRLWWLLRYLGHEWVALLDGGWSNWQASHYPVSDKIPKDRLGNFRGQPQNNKIVDHGQVLASSHNLSNRNETVLIDARDRDRYLGKWEPIDPLAGHIPGAINIPWQSITDETGFSRPVDEQQKLWKEVVNTPNLMVYCGSGVTACVNLWSLALVGRTDAKLYVGGWSDWCSYQVND